jgi:hypothetical protein
MTKDQLHELFEYKNGQLFWKISLSRRVNIGNKAGCLTNTGYLSVQINKKIYRLHKIVFAMHYGYLPKIVDHINGIKNDNRIENLREANACQNNVNIGIRKDNTSGSKNVRWHKSNKKWRVEVRINKKRINFGAYDDLELADLVAQEARDKYHKEFARHI